MPTRWEESFSAVRCLAVLAARKQIGVLVGWQLSDGVVWGWGEGGRVSPGVKGSGLPR